MGMGGMYPGMGMGMMNPMMNPMMMGMGGMYGVSERVSLRGASH